MYARPNRDQPGPLNFFRLTLTALLALTLGACAVPPKHTEPSVAAVQEPDTSVWYSSGESDAPESTADAEPLGDSPTRDMWERMRTQFTLAAHDNPRIEHSIQRYTRNSNHLAEVMDRAEPYLYLIMDELERRGMPAELALLPVVESGYEPTARSPRNAAGLWQFVPATGRVFGLEQNWWYDGRRDVLASTQAALDYLEKLHQEFDGDWLLALAAYNSGEGTVRKAIRNNERAGLATDYWSLRLPAETRAYVPKLLAISSVVAEPEKYGVTLKPIADEPFLTPVEVDTQLDLGLAAELAGLSLEDLHRYNPGFKHRITGPEGPFRLLLPVDSEQGFQDKLAELSVDKRMRWRRYQVHRGETLGQIAARHGTSIAMLRELNRLPSSRVRAGTHLMVPMATRANLTPFAETRYARSTHVVASGESLWSIARLYGTRADRLAAWNGLPGDAVLRPGQRLQVRGSVADRSGSTPKAIAASRPLQYTVRKGDTLSHISQRFKVSVAELRRWNDLSHGAYLMPGQKLMLYPAVAINE